MKNKFEAAQIFGNIHYLNVATNLAWFELTGRAEDIDREVDNYRSVTADTSVRWPTAPSVARMEWYCIIGKNERKK